VGHVRGKFYFFYFFYHRFVMNSTFTVHLSLLASKADGDEGLRPGGGVIVVVHLCELLVNNVF